MVYFYKYFFLFLFSYYFHTSIFLEDLLSIVEKNGWIDPVKTELDIKTWLTQHGYVVPTDKLSIHSTQSLHFLRTIVCADPFVEDICINGVSLEFKSDPPLTYEEDNNLSAKQYMHKLCENVFKWEAEGSVHRSETPPAYINPMTINIETDDKGAIKKWRPCFDASRKLNIITVDNKIKLSTLDATEHLLSPGCHVATFDCSNMYFHFNLNKKYHKYMGFKIVTETGEIQYYYFSVMCYGLKGRK